MKSAISLLLFAAAPVVDAGMIIATVNTNRGDFTIQLDYVHSPKTVANFIRLANGSAPWIDEATGVVQFDRPFYDGLAFYRVTSGLRSEVGSRNGGGSDGPGFMFPDEVDNGLSHDAAYVVSMGNSGPNTNGSRFFITASSQTGLDGSHTVFGHVVGDDSQAVCDAINTTETDGSGRPTVPVIIESIDVYKINTNFDPDAQGIPEVVAPRATVLFFNPENVFLHFTQPNRSLGLVYHSDDGESWRTIRRYRDPEDGSVAATLDVSPQTAGKRSHLFAASVVYYGGDAVFPDSMNDRTLRATHESSTTSHTIVYEFDSKGGGTYSSKTLGGGISGKITSYDFIPDGYGAWLTVHLSDLSPMTYRLGFDAKNTTTLWGRHTGAVHSGFAPTPFKGTFTLTR